MRTFHSPRTTGLGWHCAQSETPSLLTLVPSFRMGSLPAPECQTFDFGMAQRVGMPPVGRPPRVRTPLRAVARMRGRAASASFRLSEPSFCPQTLCYPIVSQRTARLPSLPLQPACPGPALAWRAPVVKRRRSRPQGGSHRQREAMICIARQSCSVHNGILLL